MEKIKLAILGLSSSQSHSGSFALLLGEENGNRRLPIVIGMFEAQAIAIEMEQIAPNRPMTHDLFRAFADEFHYRVSEILISDLSEGIFYAKIICSDGIRTAQIDARPSDAIAIGLRFKAPIYTFENILSEAGIVINEADEPRPSSGPSSSTPSPAAPVETPKAEPPAAPKSWQERLKDTSSEQLQAMLETALSNEDYEKAAIIRDELNRRN
ncbi:hypothetical protein SAMN05421780_11813 [Flexibacter flexilis DSM 6793]|uniref:BFN domain-containing protein n=1 Tax=Flexibacter flexilis DSM 6793 TaxID=927664 RepID=A0A1I1NYX2_9BACT|nr:bifunctional nuclease family protein [Flexibacter flexilis]SFC99923.1 hypothetical protein SAMN05421780_11813 [Flexibacter flexilis DSM 6793]